MKRPTKAELADFEQYCRQCTDRQVVNVYLKESGANRKAYARVALAEAKRRNLLPID